MTILFKVQINIALSILLLLLLGHAFLKMNRKILINRLFIYIMGLTWITLFLETLSIILNNPNLKQFMVVHKLVNVMGFLVAPCIPFLGYLFIRAWVNRYQEEKIKVKKIILLPLFINGVLALSSFYGGELFFITNENLYERGPLFFILPYVSYLYFGLTLAFIYKQRDRLNYSELITLCLINIIPALFTIIQLKYSIYLTTWNSTAIIIVVTYIFILNDQVYRDSMSGLENRLSLDYYAQNIDNKTLNSLSIIYIDIDDFKTINDQYGHGEGDEAIKSFAQLLVESFPLRQKKIIRMGGDEFLILLEGQTEEKVSIYMQNLMKRVQEYNISREKPYILGYSYGLAINTNSNKDIYQHIKYADQLMYEHKKRKKC